MPTPTLTPQEQARIRAVALCVFWRNNHILVAEGYDHAKDEVFYRPLGGGMEFGEYSWEAVRREIREELKEEIKDLTFIGPTENVFEFEGKLGHEILFVFQAEFERAEMYRKEEILGKEDSGEPIRAVWKPLLDFKRKRARLYPEGLLDMLLG